VLIGRNLNTLRWYLTQLSRPTVRSSCRHRTSSTRVSICGTKRYINHAKIDYYRWVNNNDIATIVPLVWFGYRHSGKEMYLDAEGKLKKLNKIERGKDQWKGFFMGLRKNEFDHFSDHLIDRYVEHIYKAALEAGHLKLAQVNSD
jgi:hypothetical protein